MNIKITEEPIIAAAVLSQVPISFEVETVFDVSPRDGGLGGLLLSERRLDIPYFKDYDTAEGEGPTQWSGRFDVSKWGFIVARSNGAAVGGAVVAFNTEERWSEDVSEDVAQELRRRCDLEARDVPSSIQDFVERHEGYAWRRLV